MKRSDLIPIESRQWVGKHLEYDLVSWKIFTRGICKSQFVKNYLMERDGGICPWCENIIVVDYSIHHTTYKHYCHLHQLNSTPEDEKADKRIETPNCAKCLAKHSDYFHACMEKLVLLHNGCNWKISLLGKENRARLKAMTAEANKKSQSKATSQEKNAVITSKTLNELREFALEIGNTGKDADLLKELFFHKDSIVKRRACISAGKLKNKRIVKEIIPCLYDKDSFVRQYALKAVLESNCEEVYKHIAIILEREDYPYNIELCNRILKRINSVGQNSE